MEPHIGQVVHLCGSSGSSSREAPLLSCQAGPLPRPGIGRRAPPEREDLPSPSDRTRAQGLMLHSSRLCVYANACHLARSLYPARNCELSGAIGANAPLVGKRRHPHRLGVLFQLRGGSVCGEAEGCGHQEGRIDMAHPARTDGLRLLSHHIVRGESSADDRDARLPAVGRPAP